MAKGFSSESPDDKKSKELPKDNTQEAIDENFQTLKDEKIQKIEDTFEKAISSGSSKIDERALLRIRMLKERQKKAVSELFAEKRKAYEEKTKENLPGNLDARKALAEDMLKSAGDEAQKRIMALEAIISEHKKDTYITTDEAYEIEKAAFAVDAMVRKDTEMPRLAKKISEGKEELTAQEYLYIVNLMNPYEVLGQRTDLSKTFEATSAGALIGIMKPDQRYHLVEVFMESPKQKDTIMLIDSFMRTGILTNVQGEKLMQAAVSHGLLTREVFEKEWKVKFDTGYFQEETKKFQKVMEDEKAKDYRGIFSNNLMERVTGRPLVGGLMALWGTIVVAMNVAANMGQKGARMEQLKTLFKNPYMYAGLGGMVAGTEIATGTLKEGTNWFGAGVIGRGIDSLDEKDDEESKTAFEKQMKKKMIETYMNSPKEVMAYLDNGGFETLMKFRTEKLEKKELPIVKLDELIMMEKVPTQIARLNDIKSNPYFSQGKIESDLTILVESAINSGISGESGFAKAIEEGKKGQTPSKTATGIQTPENPGFKPNV